MCIATLFKFFFIFTFQIHPIMFDYSRVPRTNLVRNLGVLFNRIRDAIIFNDHLEHTLPKALRMLDIMLHVASDLRDPFSVKSPNS